MEDARCYELFKVYKLPQKEIAQIMGGTVKDVINAIARHRNAEFKKLTKDRRDKAKEILAAQHMSKREIKERRLFGKEFPNAPPEWWAVWQTARKTKPSK